MSRALRTYVRALPKGSARFCLSAGSAKKKYVAGLFFAYYNNYGN